MNTDYSIVTTEIDAREILRYLNNLGIQNISGEILKYFITDLKKLIKYDLQQRSNTRYQETRGLERLHSASTFSSRVKSKTLDGPVPKCTKNEDKSRCSQTRNIHSAPTLRQKKITHVPVRKSASCTEPDNKYEAANTESKTSQNLIKVQKLPQSKKSDPVSLYHYYTELWEKYKYNVPGENSWADLRWNIRQKMAGNTISLKQNK